VYAMQQTPGPAYLIIELLHLMSCQINEIN